MKCKFCGKKYKAKLGYVSCPNCGSAYDVAEVKNQAQKVVRDIMGEEVKNSYQPIRYFSVFLKNNPKIQKIAHSFIIMLLVMMIVQIIGMLVAMGLAVVY